MCQINCSQNMYLKDPEQRTPPYNKHYLPNGVEGYHSTPELILQYNNAKIQDHKYQEFKIYNFTEVECSTPVCPVQTYCLNL